MVAHGDSSSLSGVFVYEMKELPADFVKSLGHIQFGCGQDLIHNVGCEKQALLLSLWSPKLESLVVFIFSMNKIFSSFLCEVFGGVYAMICTFFKWMFVSC